VIRYAFDLYPRDDPVAGSRILRFSKLQKAAARGEANGTGSGLFTIRATETEADSIDPAGLQYIRVVRINTAVVDGSTLSGYGEQVVHGFFLEKGDFEALTERSTKQLTFKGAGALSYLDRAIAAETTYNAASLAAGNTPFDDTWHWYYSPAGAILHRMVDEAIDPDRPQAPIPGVTMTFTETDDSDGNPWPGYGTSWMFTAAVGEGLLSITRRLMQAGLYVYMDPDTFELSAWMATDHPRDRTGGAWGTNIIRFQAPSAGTIATGNIKSDALRSITALIKRSAILIGANNVWSWITGSSDIVWEGSYRNDDPSAGSSTAIAEAQLAARDDAGDTVRLRMKLGNSPTTGRYLPWEHVQLDDLTTLHSGTGQWDWDELDIRVAALSVELAENGLWDAWVELGSIYSSLPDRQFQVGGVGAPCSCGVSFAPVCQADLDPTEIVANSDGAWPGSYPVSSPSCGGSDWHSMGASGGDADALAVDPETSYTLHVDLCTTGHEYRITLDYYTAGMALISSETRNFGELGNHTAASITFAFTTPALCEFVVVNFHSKLGGWKYMARLDEAGTAIANSAYCLLDPGVSPFAMRSDDPRVLQLIATMAELDATIGFSWKRPARAATTAPGTLASSFNAGDSIDGVTLAAGDRILLQDQAAGEDNGIYVVASSGAPARAADFDADGDANGAAVFVSEGTANGNKVFICTTDDPIELGVDALTFAELGGGGSGNSGVTVADILSAHRFPIAAHRGDIGSADSFPEDSMEALRQAAYKGAEIVGWDAVQSSDGTFWGSHDTTVDRVTASSGAISGKTDATLAGYAYDAGYGYDAGRHGSSIGLSTLADIIQAIEQYGCLLTIELKGGSPADLAQAIVDAGWTARTIIEVSTLADAATVKGVDGSLTVLVNQSVSGSETDDNVEWLSWDSSTLASLASAQAKAPKVIKAYQSITDYGVDETTPFNNAWTYGARSYQANNLDQVLGLRDALFYGSVSALDDLSDVTLTAPSTGQGLIFDGAEWVNSDIAVTSHWEVLMSDGISNPPDPLLNEAGDDWLYGEVT